MSHVKELQLKLQAQLQDHLQAQSNANIPDLPNRAVISRLVTPRDDIESGEPKRPASPKVTPKAPPRTPKMPVESLQESAISPRLKEIAQQLSFPINRQMSSPTPSQRKPIGDQISYLTQSADSIQGSRSLEGIIDYETHFVIEAENTAKLRRSSCAIRKRPTHAGHNQSIKRKRESLLRERDFLEQEIKDLQTKKQNLTRDTSLLENKSQKITSLCEKLSTNFDVEKQKTEELMKQKEEQEIACRKQQQKLEDLLALQENIKENLESEISCLCDMLRAEHESRAAIKRHVDALLFSYNDLHQLLQVEQTMCKNNEQKLQEDLEKIYKANLKNTRLHLYSEADTTTSSHPSSFDSETDEEIEDGLTDEESEYSSTYVGYSF